MASLPLYPTVPGSRIRLECREMVFPQPLSLELSTCQNISEDEVELEPPSLLFELGPSDVSLPFRQELICLSFVAQHFGNYCIGAKILLPVKLRYFWLFFQNSESSKEMGTNCVLATKWLKIPFNIGYLLSCLVCTETKLVHSSS